MLIRIHWWLLALFCAAHAQASTPKPLFKDFVGINGHTILFKPELYRPLATLVRDYHPAEWDLGTNSDFATPFPFARNRVDWSHVYGSWRKEGWRTDACIMFESLPRAAWKDLGGDSRAYARRLARALGPGSTNALIESVEIGNEPGKYSDADYRVLLENMGLGFREGDPKLRVATCALTTGKSHVYAKSVECIAGLEMLYDVLNVHTYAQLEGWPTWRRSYPEDPALKEYIPDVVRLCQWRDQHAAGKEVWITEFGYDATTRKPSPNSEFKQWVGVTEEQQAQWNVRSWLQFATLPVQRAYVYFFNDQDEPQVHGSSGLTRNFKPKPAFYAAAHLQRTLGDYRFERVLVDKPGEAMLYEFTHGTQPQRRVWVAWSPTGSGRKSTLSLPETKGHIERIERLALSEAAPRPLPLAEVNQGLEISETPLFIFLNGR